jgi:hypothetical protein
MSDGFFMVLMKVGLTGCTSIGPGTVGHHISQNQELWIHTMSAVITSIAVSSLGPSYWRVFEPVLWFRIILVTQIRIRIEK